MKKGFGNKRGMILMRNELKRLEKVVHSRCRNERHWREKMNTEEREYRGTYLIKIRKDGRIRIPADLKWNHGDWLELTAYGFKDSIFITHIRNIHEVNTQRCMCCGRNYPVKKELSIPDAETKDIGGRR